MANDTDLLFLLDVFRTSRRTGPAVGDAGTTLRGDAGGASTLNLSVASASSSSALRLAVCRMAASLLANGPSGDGRVVACRFVSPSELSRFRAGFTGRAGARGLVLPRATDVADVRGLGSALDTRTASGVDAAVGDAAPWLGPRRGSYIIAGPGDPCVKLEGAGCRGECMGDGLVMLPGLVSGVPSVGSDKDGLARGLVPLLSMPISVVVPEVC